MRKWYKNLDEIDRDCADQYEIFLGRKLKNESEYMEIDSYVDEMILEYENEEEFFENYPKLKRYK